MHGSFLLSFYLVFRLARIGRRLAKLYQINAGKQSENGDGHPAGKSMKSFGPCNISWTFGFYNILTNRQETLKGVVNMSVLQTIDLKKYYGTEPNIARLADRIVRIEDGKIVESGGGRL